MKKWGNFFTIDRKKIFQILLFQNTMINRYIFFIFIDCMLYLNCFSQIDKDTTITIHFETNSYEIGSNEFTGLKFLSNNYLIKSITGYADSTGTIAYNLLLSEKRAFVVYNAFKNATVLIDKNIISYKGESTEEPELWKNRKVQIIAGQRPLTKIERDTVDKSPTVIRNFDLEYVYFIPDQAEITQESISYIRKLAEILKSYKSETFEIIGHINYQSRFDSSHLTDIYKLSERRAKVVYDYLVDFGISVTRMTFRGVGNSVPIYPSPANDEQRKKNMRVQVIIKK